MSLASSDKVRLFAALREAWAADTSAQSTWSADCPSQGQCAVTALVVQDYLGGRIVRGEVEGVSHYWNRVAGEDIDLTRDQFVRFVLVNTSVRAREYILSFPDTARRYNTLRRRVAEMLACRYNSKVLA